MTSVSLENFQGIQSINQSQVCNAGDLPSTQPVSSAFVLWSSKHDPSIAFGMSLIFSASILFL